MTAPPEKSCYPTLPEDRKLAILNKKATEFQFKLYDALLQVPKGKVTTYGELARYLKCCPRAVGQAVRKNPFAPYVPCHRVITSSGEIGSYSAKNGLCPNSLVKQTLLVEEGINVITEKGKFKLDAEEFKKCFYTLENYVSKQVSSRKRRREIDS